MSYVGSCEPIRSHGFQHEERGSRAIMIRRESILIWTLYREACVETVQNSTPIGGGSANLTGLLFQFLLGFGQIRQDARLHFPPDAAANETAEETAHTVASAAID